MFLVISDHFVKISEDFPNFVQRPEELFETFSEHFQTLLKITKDCQRLTKTSKEDPKMYNAPTNLSVVNGTKKIIKNDIFTCEDII